MSQLFSGSEIRDVEFNNSKFNENNYQSKGSAVNVRNAASKDSDIVKVLNTNAEVEVVGESDSVECVYRFYGQNIDSSVEGDIIESPCYLEKSTAIQELMKAKRNVITKYGWMCIRSLAFWKNISNRL